MSNREETDETVGWVAFWTVAIASLVLSALFTGVAGGAIVLAGIGIVTFASHHSHGHVRA